MRQKRQVTLSFFGPFFISFASLMAISLLMSGLYIYNGYSRAIFSETIREEASVSIVKHFIEDSLNTVYSDLSYTYDIVSHHLCKDFNAKKSRIEQDLTYFSQRRKIYDQIRYIDSTGQEVIRINLNNHGAEAVPQQLLQNKQHRYYFTSAVKLDKGMVYISPLDLNIENYKVEVPHKPMIRFAVPVFDDVDAIRGIVVLNYLAMNFLEKLPYLQDSHDACTHVILNSEGYWLYDSVDPELSFRFMFPEKEQIMFQNRFPEAYKVVYSSDKGVERTTEGVFIWNTIYPQAMADEFNNIASDIIFHEDDTACWKNISYISKDALNGMLIKTITNTFSFFPLIALFIFIVSLVIARLNSRNREYRERIRQLAHFDMLTGVSNRYSFLDMAEKSIKLAVRKNETAVVLFIDLDGFKSVNDTYGHEVGDIVLKTVASRLMKTLRESDLTARFGGDEFVVLLQGVKDNKNISTIIEKIQITLEEPIDTGKNTVKVGCSVGSAFFPEDGTTIKELLERADSTMYENKRERK